MRVAQPQLAHLFLIRNNLNHEEIWKRFFCKHENQHTIYVHAKWPEQLNSPFLRSKIISEHCETEYAKVSLVEAEILLLKAALQHEQNQFFLLHSESCIPIRSFDFVYRELNEAGKSWLCYHQGSMKRYRGVNQQAIKSDHFFKSSQFFCLTRSHAHLLVDQVRLEDWKNCWCADEHCFATVLAMNGKLNECLRRDLTFAAWPPRSGSPTTFHAVTSADLKMFQSGTALFARKLAADSNIADFLMFE